MSKNNINNDVIEVSIIRSSDGCKRKFTMAPTSSLSTLKSSIATDPQLGPIPPNQQRLFHLGRELKSSNRSLEALGIGKYNVFTVHLHGSVGTAAVMSLLDSDQEDEIDVEEVVGSATSRGESTTASSLNEEVEVVDMTTTATTTATVAPSRSSTNGNNQHNYNNKEVVDLLDSDDDDVVEIVECSSSNKRHKRN